MNKRIKAYVDSLFAELKPSDSLNETKEELVINLNEKYQDLINDGLTPEQAYKKVIASIGDVEELIQAEGNGPKVEQKVEVNIIQPRKNPSILRAIAIAFFIMSPVPIIVLESISPRLEVFGLVSLFVFVAIGVVLLMISRSPSTTEVHHNGKKVKTDVKSEPTFSIFTIKDRRLLKNIDSLVYIVAAILFFTSFFGYFRFRFTIFILAYALTKLIELVLYYIRLNAVDKANRELSKGFINHEFIKIASGAIWAFATAIFFSGFLQFYMSWVIFLIGAALIQLLKTILDVEVSDEED